MFSLFTGFINKLFNTKKPFEIKTYDKSKCVDLDSTAKILASVTISNLDYNDPNLINIITENDISPIFPHDLFEILFEFVYPKLEPDSDQIDSMLLVARVLLAGNYNNAYEEFIFNCPEKFLITYANNSERTPQVLSILKSRQMIQSYNTILKYVSPDKLNTWSERYNYK